MSTARIADWRSTTGTVPSVPRWARLLSGLLAAVIVLPLAQAVGASAQASSDPCINCHLEQEDERLLAPAQAFIGDVHAEQGFGCLACHGTLTGGSPDAAAGFLTAPLRREVPGVCASCHADAEFMRDYNPNIRVDQFAEYVTSVHGQRLMELDDPEVATCTSCHPAHGIRPPSDPESTVHPLNVADLCGSCHADPEIMGPRGHETDELSEYMAGIHGQMLYEDGDLSAPTCNDCHGNHGAAPPGVSSVQNVCGQCHVQMEEFFAESEHQDVFSDQGLPVCTSCHDNHRILEADDDFLAEVSRDVCRSCHTEGDVNGGEFDEILEMLRSLEGEIAVAHASLDEAEKMGMEVSQAQFELEDVNNALTLARTAVHSFHTEPVRQEVERGRAIVTAASERARGAFDEHRFRRVGLAGSAVVVAILVLGLWIRIREFDLRLRRGTEAMRSFFDAHLDPGRGDVLLTPERARIAGATLLLELAQADVPEEAKRAYLADVVRREVGSGPAVEDLIGLAERQRVEAMDVGQMSNLMADRYSRDQKIEMAEAVWALVLSDPELARLQGRFLLRIPDFLGLAREDLESALERVQMESLTREHG